MIELLLTVTKVTSNHYKLFWSVDLISNIVFKVKRGWSLQRNAYMKAAVSIAAWHGACLSRFLLLSLSLKMKYHCYYWMASWSSYTERRNSWNWKSILCFVFIFMSVCMSVGCMQVTCFKSKNVVFFYLKNNSF